MTLMEILIAMLVLLVGIYTVARGFPLMLQSIRGEGDKTIMARLAEEAMARLSDNQNGLPEAITGGPDVSSYSFSKDLVAARTTENADAGITTYPNAQEDVIEVRGETFRVPAPYQSPGAGYTTAPGWYALSQGPAQYNSGFPHVYMMVPLTERLDDPRGGLQVGGNWFYVDKEDGTVVLPKTVQTTGNAAHTWTASDVIVDYAWTTTGTSGSAAQTHYVQGETPIDVDSSDANYLVCRVHPAHNSSGNPATTVRLLAGQTRAWAKVVFGRNVGTAVPASGTFTLEGTYGATLGFNPADAGLTLKVDYQLRTTQGVDDAISRRLLLMSEEQTIPTATKRVDGSNVPFTDVRLALKHVDDEPVFTTDVQGNALTTPVHVLAVDLSTGQTYTELNGFSLLDPNLSPPLEDGYSDGIMTLPLEISGSPADYLGHVWRFYYRTLERHNVQVQRAPRSYVDADTAQTYLSGYVPAAQALASLAEVNYRTYRLSVTAAPGASDDSQVGVIEFGQWLDDGTWAEALNTSGFTVAVNYSYWPTTTSRKVVYGELHTVTPEARTFTLNHATVDDTHSIEVMAVNGVSARARGWWQTRTGQQKQLDVETVFLANVLGLVPTVR